MKIGLDIMGGDFAPAEAIKGVQMFFEQLPESPVHLLLFGNAVLAAPYLTLLEPYHHRFTFIECESVIGMNEHPTKVMKEKPDSSIVRGFHTLAKGNCDAFISAGNTGAMMVGAMYSIKPIEGVLRPCVASPVPRIDGSFNLLLDVGLNADCKPENMIQFAHLGVLYSKYIFGVPNPRVALLNIGEEEGKGNILAQAAYPLLKEQKGFNFIGNVEGRDIFLDKAEVIVCEGFVGNIVLKLSESVYDIFKLQKGINDSLLDNFNYEIYGGLPILGINKPVIIGHGISSALAFKNLIVVAGKFIASHIIDEIVSHFKMETV